MDVDLISEFCDGNGGGLTYDGPGDPRLRLLFGRAGVATTAVGDLPLTLKDGTDAMKHRSTEPTCKVYGRGGAIMSRSGDGLRARKLRDVVVAGSGEAEDNVCDVGAAKQFLPGAGVFGGGAT